MKLFNKSRNWLAIVALTWAVIACSSKLDADNAPTSQDASAVSQSIDVYKSPSCGCCANWVSHIEAADFSVAVHHPSDLNKLKDDKGILPRYQSCPVIPPLIKKVMSLRVIFLLTSLNVSSRILPLMRLA